MKRISSKSTVLYKRVFPVFWFGFIALFVVSGVVVSHNGPSTPLFPFLIVPVVMAAFGYALFRKLVFDLVDEVWDDGNGLVVKNSGLEERVALKNIINVGFSTMTSPERVTLTLREPGHFGKEITFCPPRRFALFARSPIVNDLIERVDAARSQSH